MILVDSTKYISWMRAGRNPVKILAHLLESSSVVSCGIVRVEVLRGITKLRVRTLMQEFFKLAPEIPIDERVITDAEATAWKLDRKGEVIPVADLIIASCAKRVNALVVTEDRHFGKIPDLAHATQLPCPPRH